jgi:hypothetical protein
LAAKNTHQGTLIPTLLRVSGHTYEPHSVICGENKSQTFGSVVEKIFQIIFWFQLVKVVVCLTFDGSCFSLKLVLWLWKRYSAKDTGRKSRSNQ